MTAPYFHQENPYDPSRPTKPHMFFGREEEARELINGMIAPDGHSYALFGGRRFGKTSLLLEIESQILKLAVDPRLTLPYKPLPVYVNLQYNSARSELGFYQKVVEALNKQLEKTPGLADLLGKNTFKL
jgi:hypothetical protein